MNVNFNLLRSIRKINKTFTGTLSLHAPVFQGNEREYVLDTLHSTFVSSIGKYVDYFEDMLKQITQANYAIACVNGTSALQIALHLAGVKSGELVITQSLSFVATANSIVHCGAIPVFLDVDPKNLGLSPVNVRNFLLKHCEVLTNGCRHKATGKRVAACVPMHTFGLPSHIEELIELCIEWKIPVVEDAAEALGSLRNGKHCGTFGLLGVLSFNGNKIVTTGGGGAILTNDNKLGILAKQLTTTAKKPHPWQFYHDHVAWNFRMPNLNAALGCAQLEQLELFLKEKRHRAYAYEKLFTDSPWQFVKEEDASRSNYWLCSVLAKDNKEREALLHEAHAQNILLRPAWEPLHNLPMYIECIRDDLYTTLWIAERLLNLPSGVQL